jgi:hypothetical protein
MSTVLINKRLTTESDFLHELETNSCFFCDNLSTSIDINLINQHVSELVYNETSKELKAQFFTEDGKVACTIVLKKKLQNHRAT